MSNRPLISAKQTPFEVKPRYGRVTGTRAVGTAAPAEMDDREATLATDAREAAAREAEAEAAATEATDTTDCKDRTDV